MTSGSGESPMGTPGTEEGSAGSSGNREGSLRISGIREGTLGYSDSQKGPAGTSGSREGSAGTSDSRRCLQKLWQWEGAAHLSKHVPLTCTPQSCPEAKRNRWRLNEGVGKGPEPLVGSEGPTWTPTPLPPLCRNKATQLRKGDGSSSQRTGPPPPSVMSSPPTYSPRAPRGQGTVARTPNFVWGHHTPDLRDLGQAS